MTIALTQYNIQYAFLALFKSLHTFAQLLPPCPEYQGWCCNRKRNRQNANITIEQLKVVNTQFWAVHKRCDGLMRVNTGDAGLTLTTMPIMIANKSNVERCVKDVMGVSSTNEHLLEYC